jgi:hypothetical protein
MARVLALESSSLTALRYLVRHSVIEIVNVPYSSSAASVIYT